MGLSAATALMLGAFFCAHVSSALADAKPPCKAPAELTKLDRPLSRVAHRLLAHQPVKIVAIGSSSTAGAGASTPSASYPAKLEADLRARFADADITVINRGTNGETASDMVARFDADVIAETPDLVLWQVGSNSVLRDHPLLPAGALIREGVHRLKDANIDVVLINLQFAPKILAKHDAEGMVTLIDTTAKELNVAVFRRFSVMRHWHAANKLSFDTFVTADGLHLNDWGYECWAKSLGTAIAEAATRPTVSANATPSAASNKPGTAAVPASAKPAP
jgi:lysophospholipase L1-like esterase